MLIVVDPNSGVPAYRQIVEQIRFQVLSGVLQPGDVLPSTRTLSQELGLNPMTVSKSYGILEEKGVLDHRPGLPLVVSWRNGDAVDRERLVQLEALLDPAITAAQQLGIQPAKALGLFRRMLENTNRKPEPRK
ncbi:MAG: GntR family transcriptional regulator [Gemmatimonadota bacterium]|nr:GntR family transcriptional regulator [Gemmatimonadota bacterium]